MLLDTNDLLVVFEINGFSSGLPPAPVMCTQQEILTLRVKELDAPHKANILADFAVNDNPPDLVALAKLEVFSLWVLRVDDVRATASENPVTLSVDTFINEAHQGVVVEGGGREG